MSAKLVTKPVCTTLGRISQLEWWPIKSLVQFLFVINCRPVGISDWLGTLAKHSGFFWPVSRLERDCLCMAVCISLRSYRSAFVDRQSHWSTRWPTFKHPKISAGSCWLVSACIGAGCIHDDPVGSGVTGQLFQPLFCLAFCDCLCCCGGDTNGLNSRCIPAGY